MVRAIVVGATGACGRSLVAQLTSMPTVASVVAITRRDVSGSEGMSTAFPGLSPHAPSKLLAVNIGDHARLTDPAVAPLFSGATWAFCCLGASRADPATAAAIAADPESAEAGTGGGRVFETALQRVDYDFMMAFGRQAAAAGCSHMQTISAMGVSPHNDAYGGVMGSYGIVKGKADEDALSNLAFSCGLTIIRPGLLARGNDLVRPNEMAAHDGGNPGTPVDVVARAMIVEAMRRQGGALEGAKGPEADSPTAANRVMNLSEIEQLGAGGAAATMAMSRGKL